MLFNGTVQNKIHIFGVDLYFRKQTLFIPQANGELNETIVHLVCSSLIQMLELVMSYWFEKCVAPFLLLIFFTTAFF